MDAQSHPNSLKTHCPQGHDYAEHGRTRKTGGRRCMACEKERNDARNPRTTAQLQFTRRKTGKWFSQYRTGDQIADLRAFERDYPNTTLKEAAIALDTSMGRISVLRRAAKTENPKAYLTEYYRKYTKGRDGINRRAAAA